jgi:acyl CoA:acetate/3-ketoacid CoA transferase
MNGVVIVLKLLRNTARNFNPNMATAADVTIAEVEEIVQAGELKPDEIHVPGIYVDRVIKGPSYVKRIEVTLVGEFLKVCSV